MNKLKILGIDASTKDTGWSILEGEVLVAYGSIMPKKGELSEKLLYLYEELRKVIKKHNPDIVACEDQYLGKNVNTIKTLSQLKGVISLLCQQNKLFIKYYYPSTIKKAVTNNSNASKQEIINTINDMYNTDIQNDNIADAIAIAYTLKEAVN